MLGPDGLEKIPVEEPPIPEAIIVAPEDVEMWRELVSPWLYGVEACSRGTNDLDSTLELCKEGKAQLWLAIIDEEVVAASVSEVRDYPLGRVVCVWCAGGDVKNLAKCHAAMDDFAREHGASKVQFEVPPWAEKIGQLFNLKPVRLILERELYSKERDNG